MKPLWLLVAACFAVSAGSPVKQRDWKNGTLIDQAEVREVAGTTSMGRGTAVGPVPGCPYCPAHSSAASQTTVVYGTLQGFVIKGDDMVWMVQLLRARRPSKQPSVTINGPLKYAYEKGRFYLLDELGREFEMRVMRKQAIPPPPATPPAKL